MSEVAAQEAVAEAGEGPKPVRIGLLGSGTVGAAFAELLAERADAVQAATGRRPELAGVLTRSQGDFAEILERSDLVVELMGGTEPAREYAIAAMRAGQPLPHHSRTMLTLAGKTPMNSATAAIAPSRRVRGARSIAPVAASATPEASV